MNIMIRIRLGAAILLLTAGLGYSPVHSETPVGNFSQGNIHEVVVPRFGAHLIQTRQPVKRVSVAEPTIADVKVISPFDLLIEGRGQGITTCVVWYKTEGGEIYRVKVNRGAEVETLLGTELSQDKSLWGW